jgi:hypothetical protein
MMCAIKMGHESVLVCKDIFKEFVGMCRVLQIQYFFATILFKRCKMHTAICETEIKVKPVKKPM